MTQPDVAADRVAAIKRLFPAKFTDTIIDVLEEEIRGRMLGVGTLLDPCVGVGGIHELAERMPGLYTVGVDIEEEFAACHERSVHGDSTTLGVPGATARTRLERVLDGRKVNAVGVSFPYGNRLCLAAGTLVTTQEGQIPIEDDQPGALVLTHRGRWRRVTWAGSTGVKSVVTVEGGGGGPLTCTPDHRVWSLRSVSIEQRGMHTVGWRQAQNLAPDPDGLTPARFAYWLAHTADGANWHPVRSVAPSGEAEVFDLEVEDDHSFVANGIAVHNSDQYLGSENEKCRKCMGRGWVPSKEWAKANGGDSDEASCGSVDREQCSRCGGLGKAKSDRQGYVFAKGDRLTVGSGAAVAFGRKYVSIHQRIMDGTARFVNEHREGAAPFWWFVNVSSFIKDDTYVPVMEWWVGEVSRHAEIVDLRAVGTPRHGFGQNAEKRVPVEHVIIARA